MLRAANKLTRRVREFLCATVIARKKPECIAHLQGLIHSENCDSFMIIVISVCVGSGVCVSEHVVSTAKRKGVSTVTLIRVR